MTRYLVINDKVIHKMQIIKYRIYEIIIITPERSSQNFPLFLINSDFSRSRMH